MDERHLDEDELIALALGDLGSGQASALSHLNTCPACRSAYDDLQQTVDGLLSASPRVAPPTGFDANVLDRLVLGAPARRRSYRSPLLAAAAAIIGLVFGGLGANAIFDQAAPTASDRGAALVTGGGKTVGTVEPSEADGGQVVVIQIIHGRPGNHYTCRMTLENGTVRDAGEWLMPASGRATWIVPGPASSINRVDLVTDDGRVWSTATWG